MCVRVGGWVYTDDSFQQHTSCYDRFPSRCSDIRPCCWYCPLVVKIPTTLTLYNFRAIKWYIVARNALHLYNFRLLHWWAWQLKALESEQPEILSHSLTELKAGTVLLNSFTPGAKYTKLSVIQSLWIIKKKGWTVAVTFKFDIFGTPQSNCLPIKTVGTTTEMKNKGVGGGEKVQKPQKQDWERQK